MIRYSDNLLKRLYSKLEPDPKVFYYISEDYYFCKIQLNKIYRVSTWEEASKYSYFQDAHFEIEKLRQSNITTNYLQINKVLLEKDNFYRVLERNIGL